jgi:hypothetical protein
MLAEGRVLHAAYDEKATRERFAGRAVRTSYLQSAGRLAGARKVSSGCSARMFDRIHAWERRVARRVDHYVVELVPRAVGEGPDQIGVDDNAYSELGFVPDFIKIDVDGGELAVLRSASRVLGERHPALIVETHSHGGLHT